MGNPQPGTCTRSSIPGAGEQRTQTSKKGARATFKSSLMAAALKPERGGCSDPEPPLRSAPPAKLCCSASSLLQLCGPTEPSRPGQSRSPPRAHPGHYAETPTANYCSSRTQAAPRSANCSRQPGRAAIGSERSRSAAASPVLTAASEPVGSLSPQ